jgi:hypothetical protein
MRIFVRVSLGLATALLGALVLLGIGTGTAIAAPHSGASVVSAHPAVSLHRAVLAAAIGRPAATPASPTTTSPTDYNKGQQQANTTLARQKLIIGGICVALLAIVYVGHRAKGKHILRLKNLQNAKG